MMAHKLLPQRPRIFLKRWEISDMLFSVAPLRSTVLRETLSCVETHLIPSLVQHTEAHEIYSHIPSCFPGSCRYKPIQF